MIYRSEMVDDIPAPIFHVSEGMIIWANFAAQEWLDRSLKSLANQPVKAVFETVTEVLNATEKSKTSYAPVSLYDYILHHIGGRSETVNLTIFPMSKGVGWMFQRLGFKPDRVKAKDQTFSAMGRMLAHEIKNPLAGISGAAQLLQDDIKSEEGKSLLWLIRSESARISRLTDRMEALGDPDPDKIDFVNIHEILTKARQLIQSSSPKFVKFTETYDPSLPFIKGDPDTLMQAVLNLIKNATEAIEYSGQSGEVRLETCFRSGVTRRISKNGLNQTLPIEIRISDDGPGIPDDLQRRLFQPFVTSKPSGQGLGLSLVSKIASAHGGLVEHASKPGKTVFSILLPLPSKNGDVHVL